nr:unnamed protein product [Callosobruchus chinensis]
MSVDSGGLPPGKKRKEDHVIQSDVDGEQHIVNRSGNIDSDNNSRSFDINQETVSPNVSVQNVNIIPVQKQTERQALFYKATDKGPYYVSNYIQKVILCHNCMRYGHLGKQCKSKPKCAKCFEEHSTSSCNHIPDDPKCFYCEGNHYTFEMRKCDEFHVQRPTYSEQHHTSSNSSPSTSRRTEKLNNRSSRFTHFQTKPVKRSIPVSPDATEITRNQIVRQISTPNKPEAILRKTIYQEHTNINRHTFIENVLEVYLNTSHESITDYNSFIKVVNQAAEATIPKYKNNVQIKRGKPWWTTECSEAINRCRDSFKIY